ncbi:MAG: B12-binding domain-containing radical SAM protein [Rhodothermales bacterium]|nr:B12-binding domain-containing radical SAM protein [Rhodothermales bacterium]
MRIALIAMSGIRACDAELMELGLNLPGFVERSKTIASLPSLGLLTLAALTPDHHELDYIEVDDIDEVGDLSDQYDLAAISTFSAQAPEAYDLADRLRGQGVTVVMGGLHVTVLKDEALKHCDAVVVGEGEPVWNALLLDLENDHLRHVYDGRPYNYDLADAPVPAYELLNIDRYNRLTVQTSRGCPHRCDFCASSILLTETFKQKPIENVLAEIDRIKELWDRPFIEFADDNSFVNRKYWRALLPELKKRNVKWFTETDLSVASDSELLRMMKESGCAQVLIGFESPTRAGLDGIELHNNWKFKRFDKYKEAIESIQSHGITVNGCFIVGMDGQTVDVFDDIFDFVRDSGLYEVQITLLTPFPGTPLYARLEREGRLTHPGKWERCTLFDLNFVPKDMSEEEALAGFRQLAVNLYAEEITQARRNGFRTMLRETNLG